MTPIALQSSLLFFAAGATSAALVTWLWRRVAPARQQRTETSRDTEELSARGAAMLAPAMPYLKAHLKAVNDEPYDRENRPDGMISLCIAENRLGWPYLQSYLTRLPNSDGNLANYGPAHGNKDFLDAVARVMTKFVMQAEHLSSAALDRAGLRKVEVNADDLVVNAGVSALLHQVSMCLFEENDTVMVLAPCYPAFFYDTVVQARLDMLPIVLKPKETTVSQRLLETAMTAAKEAGKRVRGILITTPTNPSGEVLTKEELLTIIEFSERHNLHLISDEVYALSIHAPGLSHVSVAHLRPSLGKRIHVLWGLSKDLCASGARVGVLWTQNEAFKTAMSNVSILTTASTFAQYIFTPLLLNDEAIEGFVAFNSKELRKMYGKVTTALQSVGVAFAPAQAGMFLWLDLRELLAAPAVDSIVGWTAEEELTEDMIKVAGIVLTPGKPFRSSLPGFYRMCFAWNRAEVTDVGVARFVSYVKDRRKRLHDTDPVRRNLFKKFSWSE